MESRKETSPQPAVDNLDQSLEQAELASIDLQTKVRQQRVTLERLQAAFDESFAGAEFEYLDMERVTDDWLERVRATTELLQAAEEFGIRLFVDDLHIQHLPLERMSGEILFETELLPGTTDGKLRAQADHSGKVRIPDKAPSKTEQLEYFIIHGRLHPQVEELVHELIHVYHFDQNDTIEQELTEAQAYCNGIMGGMEFYSVDEAVAHMKRDYKFSDEEIRPLVNGIYFLYSQGVSPKQLADHLRQYDHNIQARWLLEEKTIKPFLETAGIPPADMPYHIERYLLDVQITIAKARLIFLDIFAEDMAQNSQAPERVSP